MDDKFKGSSPSPAINQNVQKDWATPHNAGQTAEQALADRHTKNPVDVPKK